MIMATENKPSGAHCDGDVCVPAVKAEAKVEAKSDVPDRFKKNLLKLVGDVNLLVTYVNSHGHDTVPPILLSLGRAVIEKTDAVVLINLLTQRSYPYWEQIRTKEEKFFEERAGEIFKELNGSDNRVDLFKTLFSTKKPDGTPLVGPANRNTVWFTIHKMVRLILEYPQTESILTRIKIEAKLGSDAAVQEAKSILAAARKAWDIK